MHNVSSPIATLYFDTYRIYCALFEPQNTGEIESALTLTYLNATSETLDLALPSASSLPEMLKLPIIQELADILQPIQGRTRSLGVAMPMETVLAHQIPYSNTLTTDELRRILRLEVSEHLPDYDPSDFLATIYPLYGFASSPFSAMSVLVSRRLTGLAEHAASLIGADVQRFVSAQTAAHTAFHYHYPEERSVVALCGVQHGYMDLSLVRNNVLLQTATIPLRNADKTLVGEGIGEFSLRQMDENADSRTFAERCNDALSEASEQIDSTIDAVYFFGSDFTKAALDEASAMLAMPARRMNPLRNLRTTLEPRLQQYASQIAHTLVPSIGAALPEIQPGIILSTNLPQQRQPQRKTA